MTSEARNWMKYCCVTYGTNVLANFGESEREMHNCPESLEEADNRMLVHTKTYQRHNRQRYENVPLLGFMPQFLELHEEVKIWIDYGTGDHRKTISIHDVYEEIGETICLGLNFIHAFTGRDSTCSFYRKTKSTWYETWMTCPMWCDITNVFQNLSWMPSDDVVLQTLPVIENFVSFAYNSKSKMLKRIERTTF